MTRLTLRREQEYRDAERLEFALRTIAELTPAWLYDAVRLGSLVDDLNRARFDYETTHPGTQPISGIDTAADR